MIVRLIFQFYLLSNSISNKKPREKRHSRLSILIIRDIYGKKNVFPKPIRILTTICYYYIRFRTVVLNMYLYVRTFRYVYCENIFRDGSAFIKIAFLDAISFTHEIVFLLRI